jgi:flavin-dependent dehydrogenase
VEVKVRSSLVIGADGPRSTVGRWIGQVNEAFVEARQVEVVLEEPRDYTSVIFCPEFPGGYGWLFPKGKTANVGVGVSRALGGDVRQALDHLLDLLGISVSRIIGRTGGVVPVGGTVDSIQEGHVLLVGDAAGHTHPITGAGVFSAVVSGELAGRAAGRFVRGGGLDALAEYPGEWSAFMGGMLAHALTKRETLDRSWSDDAVQLSTVLRETWIAFRAYGRRRSKKRR